MSWVSVSFVMYLITCISLRNLNIWNGSSPVPTISSKLPVNQRRLLGELRWQKSRICKVGREIRFIYVDCIVAKLTRRVLIYSVVYLFSHLLIIIQLCSAVCSQRLPFVCEFLNYFTKLDVLDGGINDSWLNLKAQHSHRPFTASLL